MDKETYRFMYPAGVASLSLVFSHKALQWLYGTTTDDGGRETGNFILFSDLLARMVLTAGEGKGFRRPLTLSAGQRSIPKNSFLRNGTWAGNAYATYCPHLRIWGLSTPTVQGWHP